MQENNIDYSIKKLQGIPLFQTVVASKADTIIQNLTTDKQRTPLFYLLCIEMMKIINKCARKITFD